jgi:thiamine biosynthesis lipoprotein
VSERGDAWRVGVHDPTGELPRIVVTLRGMALATSGNYRNFREWDGVRFGHTINPRDGWPVQQDVVSASVLAASCMEADAYATAFMVMGTGEARRVVEEVEGLEACFIFLDEKGEPRVWLSDGFRGVLLNE